MSKMIAEDWALLKLTGEDSGRFLQGHLTCDVRAVNPAKNLLAAACNLKGRVVASMYVLGDPKDYYLFLPQTTQPILLAFWRPYFGLYRKAQMQPCPGTIHLRPSSRDQISADLRLTFNPELDLVLSSEESADASLFEEHWSHFLIKHNIAHVLAAGSGQWTPQMLNYGQHGAISYDKGCYLGQEVVARIHYRGRSNRSCYAVEFRSVKPVKVNMDFYNAKGDKVGELVNFYELDRPSDTVGLYQGLAVLNNNVADRQAIYLDAHQQFPAQAAR